MSRIGSGFVLVAVAGMLGCSVASADGVKIGAKAPEWKNLPGTDGKAHSLSDLKDAKVVVVAFTCNHCPFAEAYEDRFIEFANANKRKGVEFVAISVNHGEEDELPAMKTRASEKGFPFPYLHDDSQKIGREFGAESTPQLFVLDKDRKIVYVGAFDDKKDSTKVKDRHVENVVNALLSGKSPSIDRTDAGGCRIHYE